MPTKKPPVPRSPISEEHAAKLRKLIRCNYCPGTWDKKFVRDVGGALIDAEERGEVFQASAAQVEQIDRLAQKYRRQIGSMR